MWGVVEMSSLMGILWLCLDWFIFLQLSIRVLGYVIFSTCLIFDILEYRVQTRMGEELRTRWSKMGIP